jgi:acyl carrier protein
MTKNYDQTEQSRLADCFCAVFPALSREQLIAAKQVSMEEWDSLATVNLVTLVEEQFKIAIPPEQIEELQSFDAFWTFLTRTHTDA